MHMEFVTVGKASSDKIHVKYNDKSGWVMKELLSGTE